MEELLEIKAKTCSKYRETLCNSATTVFLENTDSDFWARGKDRQGMNTLGCLHVLTRCKLAIGLL